MRIQNTARIEAEVETILADVEGLEEVTENYDFAFGETSGDVIDFATRQRFADGY